MSKAILFDLDGTLTDPELGITQSMQYALQQMQCPVPPAHSLREYIGPPILEIFASLLGTEDRSTVDKAIVFYRERFADTGIYENEVFEDIPHLLTQLKQEGYVLYVATSKLTIYATRIVEHFELAAFFSGVYGAELDGRLSEKTNLIAHLLESENLLAKNAIMIGDRRHDIIGARANDVEAIGVVYGFGSREELSAEMPRAIAENPSELFDHIQNWNAMQ